MGQVPTIVKQSHRSGAWPAWGLVVVVAGLALVAYVRLGGSAPEPVVQSAPPLGHSVWLKSASAAAAAVAAAPAAAALPGLPRSLEGLELPGAVGEASDGRLRIDRGVRSLFDHFLSATGEADHASLRAHLRAALEARLGPKAVAEAMALFEAYVAYQSDVANNLGGAPAESVEQLRARQASVRSARIRAFSPAVVRAFFGEDDRYDDYMFSKLEILRDPLAGAAQRASRLAELRAGLPEAMREMLSASELVSTLTEVTDQWRAQKGSPQELRELREKLVGPSAADRLAALDEQNRAWDDKVANFMQQRERLLSDASTAPAQARQQLDTLRRSSFPAEEQVRIRNLEQIRDESATTPRNGR